MSSIGEGIESSEGDPRALLVINAVLSAAVAWTILRGLDFFGAAEFAWTSVAGLALVLMVVTSVVTR